MKLHEAFNVIKSMDINSVYEACRDNDAPILATFTPAVMTVWDENREIARDTDIIEASVVDYDIGVVVIMSLIYQPLPLIRVKSIKTHNGVQIMNTIEDYSDSNKYAEVLLEAIAKHCIASRADESGEARQARNMIKQLVRESENDRAKNKPGIKKPNNIQLLHVLREEDPNES